MYGPASYGIKKIYLRDYMQAHSSSGHILESKGCDYAAMGTEIALNV